MKNITPRYLHKLLKILTFVFVVLIIPIALIFALLDNKFINVHTVNAQISLDTDSDGVTDDIDLDDDNDGIFDTVEDSCLVLKPNWTTWSDNTTGTLVANDGETVNVTTYSPKPKFGLVGWVSSFTAYPHSSTLSSSSSGKYPGTEWVNGADKTSRFCFSKPVKDPVFAVNSLGYPGNYVTLTFNVPFTTLYLNDASAVNSTTLKGAEGNAILTFPGTHSCIEITSDLTENYSIVTVGALVTSCTPLDSDGDGILNYLDLDSDGDSCPDAIEGGANLTTSNLIVSSISGGNSGTGYNGISSIPTKQNLGNIVGNTPTTIGVPTIAMTGQTIGSSMNPTVKDIECIDCDLKIIKTVSNQTPRVGDTITYTLKIDNLGPDTAATPTVTDIMSSGLTFVSATPTATTTAGGIRTWNLANIGNGGSVTITYTAIVTGTAIQINNASVASPTRDVKATNNTTSVTITPVPSKANDDLLTTMPTVPTVVTPLINDTGIGLQIYKINGVLFTLGVSQSIPTTHGVVNIDQSGAIKYSSVLGFTGVETIPYEVKDSQSLSSIANIIFTIQDNDGVPDDDENKAPNGDGNGDGIPDKDQPSVTTKPNPVKGVYTTLVADSNCTVINGYDIVTENSRAKQDTAYDYLLGLYDFELHCTKVGLTVDVKFYFDAKYDTTGWKYRKYDEVNKQYLDMSAFTNYTTETVSGKQVTVANLKVTDGGVGDDDGVANGIIKDPSGPAMPLVLADTGASVSYISVIVGLVALLSVMYREKFIKEIY